LPVIARGPMQIADVIAARIKAKTLATGKPVPSESSVVQEFGVARSMVRHAVALLRERGLVYTVPQRGTYVGKPD
jgi:GntR family transcriptional regulator